MRQKLKLLKHFHLNCRSIGLEIECRIGSDCQKLCTSDVRTLTAIPFIPIPAISRDSRCSGISLTESNTEDMRM